ncbi:energy-coupled thiamine transporter ThiT [Virgibacillus dakarensis]|uniref:Thiamine transporter ThiT n=1 Tax=Lentibacillus populi TaxID=1827502 RepID=A0A9W5X6Q0_9BACI|nr:MULTISPECIES: energy-coupled thiamine transporter ThiT [Bacillaceae]MBT2216250.1 energy-coupled thiamine transporter ThiT [Virgibacillus dakarensis]MTW87698.1 energy-coupled thiamine transporter ThiT [Virgibacillus dakarensis]GGB53710.1 thiamine transporter ThiT [Lentibacillus populi]
MRTKRTLFLIEVAIFTALALMLDLVPFLSFKIWAQGGSISLAMIPIFIVAFRWGLKGGLLSGFLWGVLQVAVGSAYILVPWQGVLDYGVAFTVIGFAGVFAKRIQRAVKEGNTKRSLAYIMAGVFLGSILRFAAHFAAGVVFFGSAIDGMNVWIYSLLYNSSYILPSFVICTIGIFFLFNKQPKTLLSAA